MTDLHQPPKAPETPEVLPGIYRHFKGNRYRVLLVARHTETLEDLVIYQALYGEGKCWARPLSMWLEWVDRDGYSGPRFVREEEVQG